MSVKTGILFLLSAALLVAGCISRPTQANPAPQPTVGAKVVTPTASASRPTPTRQPEPHIVVTAPIAGQQVRSPVRVTGIASVFEAAVALAVKDSTGKIIGSGHTTASIGAPERGTFSADLSFTQPITTQTGTVEVFTLSAKDGSVQDLVAVKVTLAGK